MISDIVKKSETFFDEMVSNNSDVYNLKNHINELKKWYKKICKKYPKLDSEVLLLSVYLHDIGHYPINIKEDHAILGEKIARDFLIKNKYSRNKTEEVLHCVRSHRCKDVMPSSDEAKAFAFMDSASHLTDRMYFDMLKQGKSLKALEKIERDYRDLDFYPELKEELKSVYSAWKSLISSLIKFENGDI